MKLISISEMNWSLVFGLKANLDLFTSSKASRLVVKNPRSYLNFACLESGADFPAAAIQ